MAAIPGLEYLDVSNTGLEGKLPTKKAMKNLRVFQAWNTKLTGTIPSDIGNWHSLGKFTTEHSATSFLVSIASAHFFLLL